ncbi:MAG TPA: vitamin K epoxide reductase family protein [Candidatus Saccharibacteria bacterium]|nr:vitamin K epoxide reductase family protein [Candidatus Saccharibacteria bacterium]
MTKKLRQTTSAAMSKTSFLRRCMAILIVCATIGLTASFMLAIEEFHHIKHPSSTLACDINPIIGCGAAMDTWQGHVLFAIPNQFFGIAAFAGVLGLAVGIYAGARYARWLWLSLLGGLASGIVFSHWFIYQSAFVLKHLCPYCMVTWVVTIVAFWYVLLYCIAEKHLKVQPRFAKLATFVTRHHIDIVATWLLLIAVFIIWKFWYYFGPAIG